MHVNCTKIETLTNNYFYCNIDFSQNILVSSSNHLIVLIYILILVLLTFLYCYSRVHNIIIGFNRSPESIPLTSFTRYVNQTDQEA